MRSGRLDGNSSHKPDIAATCDDEIVLVGCLLIAICRHRSFLSDIQISLR